MTITRCPACGMATVAVADHGSSAQCEHCGQRLDEVERPNRTGSDSIEDRVRERLYGRRGLGRRPVRSRPVRP
jgi:hypothetical protein